MIKRILIIAFTVVFAVVTTCCFCFADSTVFYNGLSIEISDYSLSSEFYFINNVLYVEVLDDVDYDSYYFVFENNSGNDCVLVFSDSFLFMDEDGNSITSANILSNSSYELWAESYDELVPDNYPFFTVSFASSGFIFDISSLIGIVGSFASFVVNSPVLLALLLIGVTCSFGFVAVKVIRKVMWGN